MTCFGEDFEWGFIVTIIFVGVMAIICVFDCVCDISVYNDYPKVEYVIKETNEAFTPYEIEEQFEVNKVAINS